MKGPVELWKKHPDIDGIEVSSFGRVQSVTKYYRINTVKEWDWLNNKLKKQGKRYASLSGSEGYVQEHLDNDSIGIAISKDDFAWDYVSYIASAYDVPAEDFIEVSDLMEDEKMENEDYVVIRDDDLLKLKDENNDLIFMTHKDGFFDEVNGLHVPKSLLYPKVKMTKHEKDEFDTLKKEALTLSACFGMINALVYPRLDDRLYGNSNIEPPDFAKSRQAQNEFARAWADPSIIEVVKEKKYRVKVPPFERTKLYYCKGDNGLLDGANSFNNQDENQQFTADELKEYGLDEGMYEKVEVKE